VAMCAASASNASDPKREPACNFDREEDGVRARANTKARPRACPRLSMAEFYACSGLRMSGSEPVDRAASRRNISSTAARNFSSEAASRSG